MVEKKGGGGASTQDNRKNVIFTPTYGPILVTCYMGAEGKKKLRRTNPSLELNM